MNATERHALFAGLVFNPEGQPAQVVYVGREPCYVILDGDFRRHVPAEHIDRQVLRWIHSQMMRNRELVTEGTMAWLGRDDLFTKAMIDASLENFQAHAEQLMQQGLPEEVRTWLGVMGLRIVADVHGQVVEIEAPGPPEPGL